MSEELLRALMQLFALASDTNDITSESRNVVERFLRSELSKEQTEAYIDLYEEFVITYYKDPNSSKTELLKAENVEHICIEINKNLVQKQKLIVVLRLLEYIFADGNISKHELEFLKLLCNVFNVTQDEFDDALQFASSTHDKLNYTNQMLVISDNQDSDITHKKLYSNHLDGVILILNIKSVNMYAMRYFGNSSLTLNGQHISPERIYILTNGSSLRNPKMDPIYYSDVMMAFLDDAQNEQIQFKTSKIEYEFKNGNKGLHEFSFCEQGGRLMGIMGGSGAGKSTLLNVLNGNYAPSSGAVTINGVDIHNDKSAIEGVIGYVSQDDLLMEDLTVFQNLYFNAKLCFANESNQAITERVHALLETLGLYEAKDLKVGNPIEKVISGGQRKRLNIALELIREPSVLFVDEPTSGLSSRDSENIMDLLKQLSLKGKLIFVVIHQPSSEIFKMFDRLIILDLGGYPIYYGDPVDSVIYFKEKTNQINSQESECHSCGNVNPEQIFNIIEAKVVDEYGNQTNNRKVSPKTWYDHFLISTGELKPEQHQHDIPKSNLKTPNVFNQFAIFVKRDLLSKLSNKQYLLINLLEAPTLALILSYFIKYSSVASEEYHLLNNDNLPAYLFMAVVVALFMGLTVSAEEIIRDKKIRKRESFLNLSKGSYLWSKILILFSISAFQTLAFVLIGNYIIEIPEMTFNYWLVLFSTACFANMLGLNISASFNSAVTIYILIPFLIIPQLIFSGVIVKFDKLNPTVSSRSHVPAIGEMMASRWAFEALCVTQFKDNALEKRLYDIDKKISVVNYRKIYWYPEIESRLNFVANEMHRSKIDREKLMDEVSLLKTELAQPDTYLEYPPFDFGFDMARIESDKNEKLIAQTQKYLDRLKKYLNKTSMNFMNERDAVIESFEENSNGLSFNEVKANNTNKSLSDMVTKSNDFPKIIEVNNHLIQRENPVFNDASNFRAHFYAPQKKLFGRYWDTFWYNLGVLWTMSAIMGITLYFDVFAKLIGYFTKQQR